MSDGTKEIARDAYIYFYPIVQNLKTFFLKAVWPHNPSYRGPVNQFDHRSELLDWNYTAVVSSNNDTLYSHLWLDLEQHPYVLHTPTVAGEKRYYSVQIIDGYTFNIKTISPRTTGSWTGDDYLIAGPSYKGTADKFDEDHMIRSPSRFTQVLCRTAVFGPEDIENVKTIQNGYRVAPLQKYINGEIPEMTKPLLPVFPFIDPEELTKRLPEPEVFFTYANFIMQYIKIAPYESDLFKRFRRLNIGPGLTFNSQDMSEKDYQDIRDGVAEASKRIGSAPVIGRFGNEANGWVAAIKPPIFGTEEVMKQEYLKRAFGASVGLYGNDPAEAYYSVVTTDNDGHSFDSAQHNYILSFPSGQLPPVKDGGFWSVTMYRLPEKLFVHNPINRYSIGDRTKGLVRDADGSLTIYMQKDRPDEDDKKANWLPTPAVGDQDYGNYKSGKFNMIMRIFWPTEEALAGPYFPPSVRKAGTPAN